MLVDSHCPLQDRPVAPDRPPFVVVGTDLESSWRAVDLADSNSDVYATVGVHPHDAKDLDERTMGALERLGDLPKVVAGGEVGLDYFRQPPPPHAPPSPPPPATPTRRPTMSSPPTRSRPPRTGPRTARWASCTASPATSRSPSATSSSASCSPSPAPAPTRRRTAL